MTKTRKTTAAAAALLALAALGAQAQGGPSTFRCTGKDGKRYYGQTIPQQCFGLPVEQLNAEGMVTRRIDPQSDEKERAAKEAEAEKKRQLEAQKRETSRRDNALLATYSSENDIEEQRARALADNERTVKDIQIRIEAIKQRQAGYQKDLEFYTGKNKPPAKLDDDIKQAQVDLEAQQSLLAVKKKEVDAINAKYDEDKKRFIALTRGQ